jgi:hypothetical protein
MSGSSTGTTQTDCKKIFQDLVHDLENIYQMKAEICRILEFLLHLPEEYREDLTRLGPFRSTKFTWRFEIVRNTLALHCSITHPNAFVSCLVFCSGYDYDRELGPENTADVYNEFPYFLGDMFQRIPKINAYRKKIRTSN